MRDVFVIGVDTIKFGKYLNKSIKDLSAHTVTGCLKDADLLKKDIQALWFSNSGWGHAKGQTTIRGQVALRHMGIEQIPITNVENACASGSTAFHHAWMGVAGGLYDITMAVGAEKLYSENKAATFISFLGGIDIENCLEIAQGLSEFSLSEEDHKAIKSFREKYPQMRDHSSKKQGRRKPFKLKMKELRDTIVVAVDLGEKLGYDTVRKLRKINAGDHSPFMDIYGYAARQHMKKYGSTVEQLAIIASKNHFNSTLNPNAQYCF